MDRDRTTPAGRRRAACALVGVAVAVAAAAGAATADARVRVVRVAADASVRADKPRTTFGRSATLAVDGRPGARAYLRFRLTGLSGMVVRQASLWVHLAKRERWTGVQAATTNGRAWSERRLAWRNRPAAAPPVGSIAAARGRWRKIDVTALVRNNGVVDIVLTTPRSTGVVLDSRERARTRAPRLHLVTVADPEPSFPLRTALYDPAFPAEWAAIRSVYDPTRGHYDGASPDVLAAQLGDLSWGRFQAAMTSWDGPGTPNDARLSSLLAATNRTRSRLRWAARASAEFVATPSRSAIASFLLRLDVDHGRDRAYLRVRGRPVVFVALGPSDGCGALRRWVAGNVRQRVYLVFQDWPGSRACRGARPSDWWATAPDRDPIAVGRASYSVSPGFFSGGETAARKPRDLARWYADVRGMVASRARFQIVDSYNGWADGTAVEPATQWASWSGHGHYLAALRADGVAPASSPTVAAAVGDIGCSIAETQASAGALSACQAPATAQLVAALSPALVITMGDDMHGQATLADYRAGYDPSWGRLRPITYPAIGNHQYCNYQCGDPVAAARAGYFSYWGARAGTPGQGWYSFDAGGWHIISLSSECTVQGGCGPGSPMETWLRQDLAAHPTACTLAYWHRPRFTGGRQGEASSMAPIWGDLYRAGVELVLNGHQHQYERFRPQTPDRGLDLSGGITEIVAGTGGRSHIAPVTVRPNTVVQNADTFGVLRLELNPLSWSARFLPAPRRGSFTDFAAGNCH